MSSAITRIAGAVLACVVAGGVALAAPATAAGHPTSTAGAHPQVVLPHAGGVHPNANPTTNFGAGYFVYPGDANGLASVSATYTMPTTTCVHPHDYEWLLPGIWVYSGGSLTEQVDVNFNCNGNNPGYYGDVICITGSACNQSVAVAPGDKIVASLAYTPTHTIGTIRDITAGTSGQVVGGPITTDEVVFVGDEGPSLFGVNVVPRFTRVQFGSVQVNGQYLVDSPFPTAYDLQTGSDVQIATSAIGANGQSFTTTFKHPA